jgi:hypothetical protein
MDISFHRLNQLVGNNKITLQYDAATGKAYYTKPVYDEETGELTGTKNWFLPTREEIQTILDKTNNEKDGLQLVKTFYQNNPA